MQYSVGTTGRVLVVRFSDGDDVLGGIKDIALKEDVRAAVLWLVGGIKGGKTVVGPEADEERPPKPVWWNIEESHELLGTGTLFFEGEEPRIHLHGAFGKHGAARVGCLRAESETFLILEAVILEIKDTGARREMDPDVGMPLLRF